MRGLDDDAVQKIGSAQVLLEVYSLHTRVAVVGFNAIPTSGLAPVDVPPAIILPPTIRKRPSHEAALSWGQAFWHAVFIHWRF